MDLPTHFTNPNSSQIIGDIPSNIDLSKIAYFVSFCRSFLHFLCLTCALQCQCWIPVKALSPTLRWLTAWTRLVLKDGRQSRPSSSDLTPVPRLLVVSPFPNTNTLWVESARKKVRGGKGSTWSVVFRMMGSSALSSARIYGRSGGVNSERSPPFRVGNFRQTKLRKSFSSSRPKGWPSRGWPQRAAMVEKIKRSRIGYL
jgi:hypothetical protein